MDVLRLTRGHQRSNWGPLDLGSLEAPVFSAHTPAIGLFQPIASFCQFLPVSGWFLPSLTLLVGFPAVSAANRVPLLTRCQWVISSRLLGFFQTFFSPVGFRPFWGSWRGCRQWVFRQSSCRRQLFWSPESHWSFSFCRVCLQRLST